MKKLYFLSAFLLAALFAQESKAQCVANFTDSINGGTVIFLNSSTPSFYPTSTWDFGDGSPLDYTNSPTHNYNVAGTYTVCLSVNDTTTMCVDTFCTSVTVAVGCNNLNVTATSTDASTCAASDGTATATASGGTAPIAYTWSNASTTPTITNLPVGTFQVMVTDANGCTATQQVAVNCPYVCVAGFGDWVSGNTVNFYNTSNDTMNSTFQWDFGDATYGNTICCASHTYASSGTYTVTLIMVNNVAACTDTFVDVVTAGGPASCASSFGMVQDSFNLLQWYIYPSINGQAPLTYLWDFGDATTSTLPSPNHNYATPGQYTICLTVTDANLCSSYFCDSSSVQRSASSLQMQYATVINPLGIAEQDEFGAAVFPNPAGENLYISLNKPMEGTIRLTDLTGKIVYEHTFSGREATVDVSVLAQGIYTINISDLTNNLNQKVVIIH
jgi:PKD repeat protein